MTDLVTAERLLQLAPSASRGLVSIIAQPLEDERQAYGVLPGLVTAHCMAQLCWESANFTRLVEGLNYSAARIGEVFPRLAPRAQDLAHDEQALGNAAYADRMGNGPESSHDGYRYRGRGLIQMTGRANYKRFGSIAGIDLLANPDLASDPVRAVSIALAYWRDAGCNELAALDDVDGVTRAINGEGMSGLEERRALTQKAKEIFV